MIYYEYLIWTENGFELLSSLNKNSRVMVFDIRNRMSKFRNIENLSKVKVKNNILLLNTHTDYLVCEDNLFIDEKYNIIDKFNEQKKILCDAKTLWVIENMQNIRDEKIYYTFDLQPYEFVYIKKYGAIPVYISWKKENMENKKELLTRGRKKLLK